MHMNPVPNRPSPTQRGFSLIEVMVSMFIVSLGILALSGLMQASSRYGKTSELRSTATLLANDIADHIRANPGASTTSSSYTVMQPYTMTPSLTAPSQTCILPTTCSPTDLATLDLYNWQNRVLLTLPGGNGYISYNPPSTTVPGTRGSLDVWVAWTDPTSSTFAQHERPAGECPDGLGVSSNYVVRCVYLQVGL